MPRRRVAIYYAPLPDDPLTAAGYRLARPRSRHQRAGCRSPTMHGIAEITAEPRRYGFHATLKPPMRLARGRLDRIAWPPSAPWPPDIAPFDLPPLAVADLRGFLALRETSPCPPLQALADACVEQLDAFRAPPSEAELARRRKAGLTAEQDAMLVRWGYPYVFGTWFFHMTLTRRLSEAEKAVFLPAAEARFAPALAAGRVVSDVCVFTQATPDAAFTIAERVPLLG